MSKKDSKLEELKEKHGEVNKIIVEEGDKTYTCYLKSPDRNVFARASSLQAQFKPVEAGEFVRDNCWLDGDEEMKDRNRAKLSVTTANEALKCLTLLDNSYLEKH